MPRKKTTTRTTTKAKTLPKAKTAKKARTKKKEIQFIDGKVEGEHELSMDIEEILSPPKNPFGAKSNEELEKKLEGMNLRQMQEMAVKSSVFPSGNKTSLKNKIKKEFSSKFGSKDSTKKYNSSVEQPLVDHNSKLAKDILDILNGK